MKFKVDENLPIEFVPVLTIAGHEATTMVEEHLQGKADQVIVEACLRERCILVTLDLDFADIYAYPPDRLPGLIVLRVAHQDKGHLIEVFQRAIPVLHREPIEGRLWIVEETRIRIHGEN